MPEQPPSQENSAPNSRALGRLRNSLRSDNRTTSSKPPARFGWSFQAVPPESSVPDLCLLFFCYLLHGDVALCSYLNAPNLQKMHHRSNRIRSATAPERLREC